MNETLKRVYKILAAAITSAKTSAGRQRIKSFEVYEGCVEPGYDDGIWVVGNWNDIDSYDREKNEWIKVDGIPSRVGRILEKLDGVHQHWSDMVSPCSECNRIVLTTGDCWGWQPSYISTDYGLVCLECADAAEHFESIEGCDGSCNAIQEFDPGDHGYVQLMEFERGMHSGQDADPKLIGKLLRDAGFSRYIFNIDSTGQFDMNFSVWLHEEEADQDDGMGLILAKRALERGQTDGPSISEAMKRGLQESALQASQLRGDGIIVSDVSPDGVTTKLVSRDDFANGKT